MKEILEQDKERKIRLAVLDHIISGLAMLVPIDELIPILHAHNVKVLVDGAHAIGQIPLDLKTLDPGTKFLCKERIGNFF